MTNNTQKMIFRQVEGIWRNISGDSETLADTLERLNIIIDDCCEFARIKKDSNNKHTPNLEILYKAYGGTITITLTEY